jgi:hypothetical protein
VSPIEEGTRLEQVAITAWAQRRHSVAILPSSGSFEYWLMLLIDVQSISRIDRRNRGHKHCQQAMSYCKKRVLPRISSLHDGYLASTENLGVLKDVL